MRDPLIVLLCPVCRCDRVTEQPPCPDGHGCTCPDRACVVCGTALLLDADLFAVGHGPRRSSDPRRVA